MSEPPAVASAPSAPVSVHGPLLALVGAIEDITLSTWPLTWTQWGTVAAAGRLTNAVATALVGISRLANRLEATLLPPRAAATPSRSAAVRLMYAELTTVVTEE